MAQPGLVIIGTTLVKYTGDKEKVVVPDVVKTIGDFAFFNNKTIKEVIIPQNIVIGEKAFAECENLETLTEMDEPLYIFKVGYRSFINCYNLRTDLIFSGKEIPPFAFSGCKKIERIELPNRVRIDSCAFMGCTKLKALCHEDDVWVAGKLADSVFQFCNELRTDIRITEGIVRDSTFYDCTNIKKIFLPYGVIVEKLAFNCCRKLEQICDSESTIQIESVGWSSFAFCENLQSKIKIMETKVTKSAFMYCEKIEDVCLSDGTDIEESAFSGCYNLKNICDKRNVFIAGKLGKKAFYKCGALITPIKITERELAPGVFSGCELLPAVYLPCDINISKDAFYRCQAKRLAYDDIPPQADINAITPLGKPKRIIPKEEQTRDNIIGFNDFLVRTDVYNCRNQGHKLQEVTAVVYCLTRAGEVIEKKVMAGYCRDCKRYYLLNKEFERLRSEYTLPELFIAVS